MFKLKLLNYANLTRNRNCLCFILFLLAAGSIVFIIDATYFSDFASFQDSLLGNKFYVWAYFGDIFIAIKIVGTVSTGKMEAWRLMDREIGAYTMTLRSLTDKSLYTNIM
jgi:hypothetical protein